MIQAQIVCVGITGAGRGSRVDGRRAREGFRSDDIGHRKIYFKHPRKGGDLAAFGFDAHNAGGFGATYPAQDNARSDSGKVFFGSGQMQFNFSGSPILPPPAQGCVEVNGSDKFAVFAVGIQFHRLHPPEYRCAGHNNIQIVNAAFRIITEHIAAGFDLQPC